MVFGVIMNISWDYLDYYGLMEVYCEVKVLLVKNVCFWGLVLNVDDN